MERLQKYIASCGYTSRRKAEELIKDGHVSVNGKTVRELGIKVSGNDLIEIDGDKLVLSEKKEYYLLNKPRGVISSVSDDIKRKTVVDLIDTSSRIYPVGRLDFDTTGVIILTNDGNLANMLMHPSSNILKKYVAKVSGLVTKDQLRKIENGIIIDSKKTSPARAKIKKYDKKSDTSIVEISIHEGRNHEVKKMFKAINHDVIKLKREEYAFLDLKGLKSGEYRSLSIKEVKKLYGSVKK